MDVSADLGELGRTPVLVVSAGVKSILDIFQGVFQCDVKDVLKEPIDLVSLWVHECQRVFSDRLINLQDKSWCEQTILGVVRSAACLADEIDRTLDGGTRGNHIVDHDHALAFEQRHRLTVEKQALLAKCAARSSCLSTASAAGLLSQIGSVTYAVTKHAAVALAEWLAITYGERGIKVSVLCPQAVRTAMTAGGAGVAAVDGMIEPDIAVDAVVETIREERFLEKGDPPKGHF